jgi:MFS superfamily sulfate permease-like transporter
LGLGILTNYFPSSVIKGMLAAIGITLILKEIPHAVGNDADFFGDLAFNQPDGHNTFSELFYAAQSLHLGSILIAAVSLLILIVFDTAKLKKITLFKILPGALICRGVWGSAKPSFFHLGRNVCHYYRTCGATSSREVLSRV